MTYPRELSYEPETRIVLVGTTVCPRDEKSLPPLPSVQQNIHYLAYLFGDPDVIGLPPECIVTIIDGDEPSAIASTIATAAQEATDTLIVYYAGHGLYGDQSSPLYLAARNTTSAGKAWNALRISDVKGAMRSSRARKRILILDCCYSGRALEGGMGAVEDEVRPAIDLTGTYGIAAVPGDCKALAPPGGRLTKFTQTLVNVLERGVPGNSQILTVDDVFGAVRRQIGREAEMPLPEASNWNEGGQFRLARNRHLKRGSLEQVYVALEGLRETMTLTGARVEALEAKAATQAEWLNSRLGALESRLGATSQESAAQLREMTKSIQARLNALETKMTPGVASESFTVQRGASVQTFYGCQPSLGTSPGSAGHIGKTNNSNQTQFDALEARKTASMEPLDNMQDSSARPSGADDRLPGPDWVIHTANFVHKRFLIFTILLLWALVVVLTNMSRWWHWPS